MAYYILFQTNTTVNLSLVREINKGKWQVRVFKDVFLLLQNTKWSMKQIGIGFASTVKWQRGWNYCSDKTVKDDADLHTDIVDWWSGQEQNLFSN